MAAFLRASMDDDDALPPPLPEDEDDALPPPLPALESRRSSRSTRSSTTQPAVGVQQNQPSRRSFIKQSAEPAAEVHGFPAVEATQPKPSRGNFTKQFESAAAADSSDLPLAQTRDTRTVSRGAFEFAKRLEEGRGEPPPTLAAQAKPSRGNFTKQFESAAAADSSDLPPAKTRDTRAGSRGAFAFAKRLEEGKGEPLPTLATQAKPSRGNFTKQFEAAAAAAEEEPASPAPQMPMGGGNIANLRANMAGMFSPNMLAPGAIPPKESLGAGSAGSANPLHMANLSQSSRSRGPSLAATASNLGESSRSRGASLAATASNLGQASQSVDASLSHLGNSADTSVPESTTPAQTAPDLSPTNISRAGRARKARKPTKHTSAVAAAAAEAPVQELAISDEVATAHCTLHRALRTPMPPLPHFPPSHLLS